MTGKTAILFPGQGAQLVGMGADVAQHCARAADCFAKANALLGFDIRAACFEGPEARLAQTDIQQPAILVTSIALLEALTEQVDLANLAEATAGLSLGEYTALYFAGSLSFDDAVRLVHRRGELMQESAEAVPSGMVSLMGADEASAAALCREAAGNEVLVPANLNCPGQVVISGTRGACTRAVDAAEAFGLRAIPLKVAGAFHSPLMQPAADALTEVLAKTPVAPPRIPVLSNVTAEPHTDPNAIRRLLCEQVTQPVRWQACVELLIGEGVEQFVEVGPNRVLTGLMRKIDRSHSCQAVNGQEAVGRFERAGAAEDAASSRCGTR